MSRNPKEPVAYEAGYGRPPARTRFEPGKSGNPRGRPRKAPTFAKVLEREAARLVKVRTGDKVEHLPNLTVIARMLMAEACKGNLKAAALVINCVRLTGGEVDEEEFDTGGVPDADALEAVIARLRDRKG